MIKAIFFDWHGVLDKTLLDGLLQIISKEINVDIDNIKNILGQSARSYGLGNISDDQFWKFVVEKTGLNYKKIKQLKNYINSVSKNDELWKFLVDLKKKYKLVVLSDCPMEKVNIIYRTINIDVFDKVFFSAELHLDKKMPDFFQLALDGLEIKSNEVLFVDDSQKNIDFASNLGFKVHLFKDTDNFIKFFDNLKL